jgi:ketosteroid isomerase-like protein
VKRLGLWTAVAIAIVVAVMVGRIAKHNQAPRLPEKAAGALHELIAAERAFAAMSLNRGFRDAFLEWLDDDAVLFRPLPRNGREFMTSLPPSPATLAWQPAFAEVAAAGDLGFTTGPWEFRPPPDSTGAPPDSASIAHGTFASVWSRRADGVWRVAVDIGAAHARPEGGGLANVTLATGPDHAWAARGPGRRAPSDLGAVDKAYRDDAVRNGATALIAWGADDLRMLSEGEATISGRAAVQAALAQRAPLADLKPLGVRISKSDDLGCTYGLLERGGEPPDSSVYVHVWRRERDGAWRLALMVENPVRPAP